MPAARLGGRGYILRIPDGNSVQFFTCAPCRVPRSAAGACELVRHRTFVPWPHGEGSQSQGMHSGLRDELEMPCGQATASQRFPYEGY